MRGFQLAAIAALMIWTPAFAAGTPAAAPAAAPARPAAAAPAPARPEVWFVVKVPDGALGYDAASIKFDPALSTASIVSMVYSKEGAKTEKGAAFFFILAEDQVDCIGEQYQPKSRRVLDVTGKVLTSGNIPLKPGWVPLAGNAPLTALRGVACTGSTFKDMVQAPSFAAAVKAMREMK
jgi:hypothetical protein